VVVVPRFKTSKLEKPKKSNAGRKALPTALHILNGNPSKLDLTARAQTEPRFSSERPSCPEWLVEGAREEWDRVLPELEASGMLQKVDMAALAGYCDSLAMWKEANGIIAVEGLTVLSWIKIKR